MNWVKIICLWNGKLKQNTIIVLTFIKKPDSKLALHGGFGWYPTHPKFPQYNA